MNGFQLVRESGSGPIVIEVPARLCERDVDNTLRFKDASGETTETVAPGDWILVWGDPSTFNGFHDGAELPSGLVRHWPEL